MALGLSARRRILPGRRVGQLAPSDRDQLNSEINPSRQLRQRSIDPRAEPPAPRRW